ncbi:SpoIIIAH-like family protein [Sutcliffiella halmapala]|uniref:SpoIIIAH-like family protein n=1 Tax=Sutcliffiella halmapala TaxID=79882 RepID=UPI000995B907|nr:SpoIIIAH-like family protein [Sutcliffiella halmapala]
MLLKKQTVWLLTMLSLVFVLSAYYFIGNQAENNQMAQDPANVPGINETAGNEENTDGEDGDKAAGTDGEEAEGNTEEDGSEVVQYISGDEAFEELRLNLSNHRSQVRSDLNDQIANTELPAEVISEAIDKRNALEETSEKEQMLEHSIKSRKDVEDAIVRVTGEQIKVSLKVTSEPSSKIANEIYHLVRTEFTNVRNENVVFDFSASNN